MQPFLAMITPLTDTGGGQPPGIWGGANQPFPTPPIHIPPGQPGQPPGIWGGANQPFPTPPIHIPGQPPGIWGGGNQPFPTPPIHIPPTTLPDLPTGIWGPNDPRPTPPIYLPTPTPPNGTLIEWKAAWTPDTGWVVVGVPQVPHPAPSKSK